MPSAEEASAIPALNWLSTADGASGGASKGATRTPTPTSPGLISTAAWSAPQGKELTLFQALIEASLTGYGRPRPGAGHKIDHRDHS